MQQNLKAGPYYAEIINCNCLFTGIREPGSNLPCQAMDIVVEPTGFDIEGSHVPDTRCHEGTE